MSNNRPRKVYIPPSSRRNTNPSSNSLGHGALHQSLLRPQDVEKIEEERNKYLFRLRLLTGCYVFTVSVILTFMLPWYISWQWFLEHDNKMNIQIIIAMMAFGVAWLIVDNHVSRRGLILGSIIIAGVFTVVQLA